MQHVVVAKVIEKTAITRSYVMEKLQENMKMAMSLDPPNGSVANRALELMGKEIGMFIDRKEITHITEFDDMSDEELVLELSKEAQKLLEHTSDKDEKE